MSVDVYGKEGVMTTTNLKRKGKLCHTCHRRFKVVVLRGDGNWQCYECAGVDEPLIYPVSEETQLEA